MNEHVRSEDLAAYVDGSLSPEKKSGLENHFSRCPACLDELTEITAIRSGRGRVPADLLTLALGEKRHTVRHVLPLRLAFGVAAVFVVVIFIGYLFLTNDRFWQPVERQLPSDVMKAETGEPDSRAADRSKEPALPAAPPAEQVKTDRRAAERRASEKKAGTAADKDLPAAAGQPPPAGHDPDALQEIAPLRSDTPAEMESMPKQEQSRTEAKSKVLGPARLDAAAGSRPAAQAADLSAAQAQQDRQQEKHAVGFGQTTSPAKEIDEAQARAEIAARMALLPIRIEGDVGWFNLQNPERIVSWSWFPKDLVLELQIDPAGTVTAVATSGKADERLAARAADEAKKLIFAISEKKSRRARLVAQDAPPDQR
ncbi:MAG TPA: zf-HC2 domain-containing protein [Candidatus Binatia bacterium]|nr:zf-HC2 domain-containing protein [Candidatus Binatia bacterium]